MAEHARTALVTGATSGIGLETARALAARGSTVFVHGRTETSAAEAAADVAVYGQALPVWGDFASLTEVRGVADQILAATDVLDVLVNNAGLYSLDRVETTDGHELTFQVNHLSTFLLTALLAPAVCSAVQGRVITVSSVAHFRGTIHLDDLDCRARPYEAYGAYADSKLMNVLFAIELAERLRCHAATSNVLHPGVIATKLLATGFPSAAGSPVANGAAVPLRLATDSALASVTGAYFVDGREAHPSPKSRDAELRRALWDASEQLTGATVPE